MIACAEFADAGRGKGVTTVFPLRYPANGVRMAMGLIGLAGRTGFAKMGLSRACVAGNGLMRLIPGMAFLAGNHNPSRICRYSRKVSIRYLCRGSHNKTQARVTIGMARWNHMSAFSRWNCSIVNFTTPAWSQSKTGQASPFIPHPQTNHNRY